MHGLNPRSVPEVDHAWDTWRKPSGDKGRLWLREDLPKYAPDARIFLYQYNSKLVYGGDKARFIDKANDLLEDLRIERKKVLAHSHSQYSPKLILSRLEKGLSSSWLIALVVFWCDRYLPHSLVNRLSELISSA